MTIPIEMNKELKDLMSLRQSLINKVCKEIRIVRDKKIKIKQK